MNDVGDDSPNLERLLSLNLNRLVVLVSREAEVESATPAQLGWSPEPKEIGEGLVNQAVIVKRSGVSDGFRTRDLRIHNPAL